MRFVRTAAWLVLLMAMAAAGQTPRDRKLIAYTKAIPVSQLDPKLPAVPFERWLTKQAGAGAQIAWEVNDCGEQTGSPEDSQNDFPVCVEASATLADKRVIVVSIAVGTYQRGISGKPATWWITVGRDPSSDPPLDKLSELPVKLTDKPRQAPTTTHEPPPATPPK